MGIIESYSKATGSSNLKNDATHFATEKLAAVAWSSEMGALLFRVKYANDPGCYSRLRAEWTWDMEKRAALAIPAWPMHINVSQVANTSLNYWLNDLCPVCGGKGVRKMEFVAVLSDDPCEACEGTGKRPLECERRIQPYVVAMVEVLERWTLEAGAAAMERLRDEIERK